MNIQALHFVLDIDSDGSIASWEVLHAVKWGFSLPGRLLTEGLGNIPWVADTLGIQASAATGYASFNSLLASGASLIFWVLLLYGLTRIGAKQHADTALPDQPPRAPGMPHYRGPQTKKRTG